LALDLKEGKSQDIHQKREMQAQVYEALEREKRRLNLVIIYRSQGGIRRRGNKHCDGFDEGFGTRGCRRGTSFG